MVNNPRLHGPATVLVGHDRYPATIIDLAKGGRTVTICMDKWKHKGGPVADFEYSRDPDGFVHTFTLRENGKYILQCETMDGMPLAIGFREYRSKK